MSIEFRNFLKSFPETGKAYTDLFGSIMKRPALDEKTRQLILIGVMTAQNYPPGVRAHAEQALSAGATREEIIEAVLTPLPVAGINGVIECLPVVLDAGK